MPGVTGLELAQMIRARKKTANVPIIFLTAYYGDDHDIVEGYEAGGIDYVRKPVNSAILRSKVGLFAELYRKQRKLEETNRVLAAVVESCDDAIISTDLGGIVATFNPGAERLFGYKAEEVVGKPVTILIPSDRNMRSRKSSTIGSDEWCVSRSCTTRMAGPFRTTSAPWRSLSRRDVPFATPKPWRSVPMGPGSLHPVSDTAGRWRRQNSRRDQYAGGCQRKQAE
jgi:CheY-like chemotaxis protein